MQNLLTKVRYWMWGKSIQKSLEKAEYAGREAAKYAYESQAKLAIWELEQMKKNIDKLAYSKLCELNYAVDPEKVLTAMQDREGKAVQIKLGDRILNKTEIRNLQEQVRFYRESQLIQILQNTPKEMAQKTMFVKSETYDDMKSGKMLILAVDIQDKILKAIESFDIAKK